MVRPSGIADSILRWFQDPNKAWILRYPILSDSYNWIAQWKLWLPELDFDIVHQAANKQQVIDTISEKLRKGADTVTLEDDFSLLAILTTDGFHATVHSEDTLGAGKLSLQEINIELNTPHKTEETLTVLNL